MLEESEQNEQEEKKEKNEDKLVAFVKQVNLKYSFKKKKD